MSETVKVYATSQIMPSHKIVEKVESNPMVHTDVEVGEEGCVGVIFVYDTEEQARKTSKDNRVITMEMDEEHYQDLKGEG
jgi:hypothetical protein